MRIILARIRKRCSFQAKAWIQRANDCQTSERWKPHWPSPKENLPLDRHFHRAGEPTRRTAPLHRVARSRRAEWRNHGLVQDHVGWVHQIFADKRWEGNRSLQRWCRTHWDNDRTSPSDYEPVGAKERRNPGSKDVSVLDCEENQVAQSISGAKLGLVQLCLPIYVLVSERSQVYLTYSNITFHIFNYIDFELKLKLIFSRRLHQRWLYTSIGRQNISFEWIFRDMRHTLKRSKKRDLFLLVLRFVLNSILYISAEQFDRFLCCYIQSRFFFESEFVLAVRKQSACIASQSNLVW